MARNQTAKLKSINGLTKFVLDEAEELVDETIFDKIESLGYITKEECDRLAQQTPVVL